MSMKIAATDKCLSGDDAFCVTLLTTCEATKNILSQRNNGNKKRNHWLKKLSAAIEELNGTYPGYLTDEFQERFKEYHASIETAMNKLLSNYHPDEP